MKCWWTLDQLTNFLISLLYVLVFLGVVQNTYTNAEKLLAAAAELAQTGECNAEDIYSVAHELESHISSFAQRVEQRRRLLELSVLFYSHTEELTNWLTELRVELQSEEVAETLEGAERLLEQFGAQRDSTLDACASTIAEGKTLLDELKSATNVTNSNVAGAGAGVASSNQLAKNNVATNDNSGNCFMHDVI